MLAIAQDIEVGPIRVDTGNDWMDFGFVLVFLGIILVYLVWSKRHAK